MAGLVVPAAPATPLLAIAWLSLTLAAGSARAVGPQAPFMPPDARHAQAAQAASPDRTPASGLAGVRVGAHAGALIDGSWIALGGEVRGARLAAVQRRQVVLRHPDGRTETLSLSAPPAASAPVLTRLARPDGLTP